MPAPFPALSMGGPPPNAPTEPTLSAIPMDNTGPTPDSIAGALPKLFFNIEDQLSTLAGLVPSQAEPLDAIAQELRNIFATIMQGGGRNGEVPSVVSPATENPGLPYGG